MTKFPHNPIRHYACRSLLGTGLYLSPGGGGGGGKGVGRRFFWRGSLDLV